MVLHKVSARRDKRETILCSKEFDKLFHHVSYGGTRAQTHSHLGIGMRKKPNVKGKGKLGID